MSFAHLLVLVICGSRLATGHDVESIEGDMFYKWDDVHIAEGSTVGLSESRSISETAVFFYFFILEGEREELKMTKIVRKESGAQEVMSV